MLTTVIATWTLETVQWSFDIIRFFSVWHTYNLLKCGVACLHMGCASLALFLYVCLEFNVSFIHYMHTFYINIQRAQEKVQYYYNMYYGISEKRFVLKYKFGLFHIFELKEGTHRDGCDDDDVRVTIHTTFNVCFGILNIFCIHLLRLRMSELCFFVDKGWQETQNVITLFNVTFAWTSKKERFQSESFEVNFNGKIYIFPIFALIEVKS